jgi:hypothetical protein
VDTHNKIVAFIEGDYRIYIYIYIYDTSLNQTLNKTETSRNRTLKSHCRKSVLISPV